MASWVALNVEPDDGIEEEVDDTKELQIEEALKLYHTALKLHSQGPEYYSQAAEAYDSLLNSEIFKYPESLSDFKRPDLADAQSAAAVADDAAAAADAVAEFNVNDSTSSLFQTLYLSYKNHGKYLLDSLHETLRNTPKDTETVQDTARRTAKATKDAVQSFAEALERDDTDLNLWRQSARLGSALQSYRLNRFCLESVLADDDNRLEVRSTQLGLEETFSEERLRSTLQSLFDGLSASQIPVKKPKKALEKYLRQHADLYSYLPTLPTDIQFLDPAKGPLTISTSRREIRPSEATWEAVGQAILEALNDEEDSSIADSPSKAICVALPPKSSEALDSLETEEMDTVPEDDAAGKKDKPENEDVDMLKEGDEAAEPGKPAEENGQDQPTEEQSSIDQSAEKQLMESLEGQSVHPPETQAPDEDANPESTEPKSPSDTRKRSSASAANDEQPEGGRMKSRRTRARESNADAMAQPDEVAFDQEKYYEDRLEIYVNADDWMFNTLSSLYSKVGNETLGTIESLREAVVALNDSDEAAREPETRLIQDLRGISKTWNEEKSRLMQQKDDMSSMKDIRGSNKSGLSVFLEHSRSGSRKPVVQQELGSEEELYRFSETVNGSWLHPHQISYEWLKCLLMPEFGNEPSQWPVMKSTYTALLWSKDLKETALELLLREDEFIFSKMSELVADTERHVLESPESSFEYQKSDFSELEMIQSIYELHLDVFASIENAARENIQETRHIQNDRLARWGILARSALDLLLTHCPSEDCRQNLALRHLWASTFHINLAGEADREHILLCLQDLKHILQAIGDPCLTLLNNPTMSELSVATVDQEVLKLKCMDFFAKVFNPEDEDPVSLIEAIEPILEPSCIEYADGSPEPNESNGPSSISSEMSAFLDRGDATLRLFLWRRLQEAYQAIDYPPKIVSCYLRSIEIIMKELEDAKHLEETSGHRQVILLGWLKSLDAIMGKAIPIILQQVDKAYECVDMEHLQSSMSAVARLTRLVHTFVLYEDSIRVGQASSRELRGSLAKSFENFKERMRELYVRCWILQYTLFVEAISQNKDVFEEPLEDRIRVLRSVHNALGVRSMCRYSQKRFLKLMKSELLDLETKGDYEFDICQVLLDLHGIKFSPFDGTSDHGCAPEKLDRPTAIMMIDFVMRQAQNMNMKDLSKSDLKTTIEKMQQTIVPAKISSSPQMSFNRRIFHGYIKAALNPAVLLRAVQGVLELSMLSVPGENAQIAAKGWYFLLGHAALTKFRSQKRLSPGSTTELDDAINFFRLDIDYGSGRWETWYRLAQAYDTKLEEEITWTADKINNNRNDLAATQRYAIHCYAMAVSVAMRSAEPTNETRTLLSDLYTDFGIRMYSSSRGPLSMGAFGLSDFPRHFSSEESQQMYKGQPFKEMSSYSVWNFACNLLKRALVDKPKRWMTHYFIGKCLWKMFSCDDSLRTTSKRVEMHDVLDAFHDAISSLPKKKDSRADPVFEPHFKLVSIIHKLVLRGDMTPTEASQALQATPWARKVEKPENMDGWKPYILEVVRKFKSADKSNWHHRMSAKAAHIIYDDDKNAAAATAAKQELSQIFTKTLTIQVWRPEFERPGRHFVHTSRYVYFFVSLLDQLDDRASLDQLLRRVRKKQGDFIDHTKLWEDVCLTYAKMIRRAAHINEGHEESVFKPIGWEEFSTKTARLETLSQLSPDSLPLLELIRDSLELKKLNNNLMKVTMFEDLVADLYARVYELNMPLLIEQVNEENKEKMKVDHLLMTGDGNTEASTPAASLPASDTPAPRGRTKGIARRDVQKRADTIVNLKLGPRTAASKFTATADADQSSSTLHGHNASAGPTSVPYGAGEQTSGAGDNAGVQRSDQNSFNDTADESDLTDADESKLDKPNAEQKSLFSKIHHADAGDIETETENDGADEGEGEDDEGDENDEVEDEDDPAATEAEAGGDDEQGDEGDDEEIQDEDEVGPDGDETKLEDDVEATDKEADEDQPDHKDPDDSIQDEIAETPEPMDLTPS